MEKLYSSERCAPLPAPVVGFVIDVALHPNADRLFVATIDVDQPANVPVICGGSRAPCPGELVAVALPGTRLPGGEKIRARRWRGVRSCGELLSTDELGWTINGPDEVATLQPTECRVGQSLAPFAVQHALAMYLPTYGVETVEFMKCFSRPAGSYTRPTKAARRRATS